MKRLAGCQHFIGVKEHVAFLAPIAATVVAIVVSYYGPTLARKVGERRRAHDLLHCVLYRCCGGRLVWRLHHEGCTSTLELIM